ncbi:hypothetical protein [Streptomyces albidus (ex Kaewkla and Franco 2022)]|uniref:hypothetical protein n=1 Tax=Streptomyces albidus (ex Kaewkla and Franco 2022) TaxID=722709 RepID=UPI0015EE42D1|nr:hypothetical protein [Streptomyces albidus (ex Kaewkla and Franco 2022)]
MSEHLIAVAKSVAVVAGLVLLGVVWERFLKERWDTWISSRSVRLVDNAVRHLRPGVLATSRVAQPSTRGWAGVKKAVRVWYEATPRAVVWHVFKLCSLVYLLLNVGSLVTALVDYVTYLVSPPGSKPPAQRFCAREEPAPSDMFPNQSDPAKNCEAVTDLLVWLWRGVGWVRETVGPVVTAPWADPMDTANVLIGVVLLVMSALVFRAVVPILYRGTGSDDEGERLSIHWETAQWQPVVVLLAVCGSVGLAHRRLESRSELNAPRVSLKAAERAVWTAWRVRHRRVRRDRRGQLKEHAAQVVGALRALEARQDREADTGKVFEDTTGTLLKIAQRYAEGRTLALLDPEELDGVKPVVSREWVRLAALGLIVVGTVTAAMAAGMPEGAATPLIGAVSLIAWGALYGGRMVGTDLVDVMRGQSRN